MDDIHIERYQDDPQVKGCIKPSNEAWQLLVDHDGTPHLLIRCSIEKAVDDPTVTHGWMALDDLLPEGVNIRSLMTDVLEGHLSPEEEAEAEAELGNDEGTYSKGPCPK